MREPHELGLDLEAVAKLCRHHGVRRLSLFGSAVRDDFGPDSDVDVLVEFVEEASLDALMALQELLEAQTGRKVDVVTTAVFRNPIRRATIERDLKVIYEA